MTSTPSSTAEYNFKWYSDALIRTILKSCQPTIADFRCTLLDYLLDLIGVLIVALVQII